jgi:superfamily II DNA or RNA helicase
MRLRPYQSEAVESICNNLAQHSSTLLVLPTGCGKTVVFAHVADHFRRSGRVMVIAHREELIRQAAEKIHAITGEKPDIEMASERADSHMFSRSKVVVSSVQTLCTGRVKRFDPTEFSLLITDEAHHATATSYRTVYEHMLSAGCAHLGVTATPDRADEEALGQIFDSVAFVYELPDAINDGWLVPIRQKFVQVTGLDYSRARTTAGDLNQADVARAQSSEKTIQEMCHPIVDIAGDKKTIIFATPGSNKGDGEDYHIAEKMTEVINRHRPNMARRVSQDTPKDERRQILAEFREGRFQFLINVGVFTEGFDEPSIEIVAITRPTKSRSLYAQMVGRGTRPLPGIVDGHDDRNVRCDLIAWSRKPAVTVIDFVGNSGKHKLVTTADVLGGKVSDEVIARAKEKAEKSADGVDMADAIRESLDEIHREKEEQRRKREAIVATTKYQVTEIDPFNVFDIEPERERGWEKGRWATPAQLNALRHFGVEVPADLTMGRAGQLISEAKRRASTGRASYATAKELRSRGLPTDISAAQAAVELGKGQKFADLNAKWQARMGARS